MQYPEWRKNKAKSDTSFVSAWRDSRGLPKLSDAENSERFDSYLWLMRELDKIVLRKMRAEEREERGLSGSLSFEAERHGERSISTTSPSTMPKRSTLTASQTKTLLSDPHHRPFGRFPF